MNYGEALTLKRKGRQIKRSCPEWENCWYDRGIKYHKYGTRSPITEADAKATDWEVTTILCKTA